MFVPRKNPGFALHQRIFCLVDKDTNETAVPSVPPQFSLQKLDANSVLIEAVIPGDQPATFEDEYDVLSKNDSAGEDWTKVRHNSF